MSTSMYLVSWTFSAEGGRSPSNPRAGAAAGRSLIDTVSGWAALPFEFLRAQHTAAVRAGWLPRSAIESARFGKALERAEQLTLGPLARRR